MRNYYFEPFEFPSTKDGKYIALLDNPHILISRREQLGLTQQQVANKAGIKQVQYQRLESGERPLEACSMKVGLAICAALLLDPYEMVSIMVEQPKAELLQPQHIIGEPYKTANRVGRKHINKTTMSVYLNDSYYSMLVPYSALEVIGMPKYVQIMWDIEKRRIVFIPQDTPNNNNYDVPEASPYSELEPYLAFPSLHTKNNPIFKMGWGNIAHSCEAKLVKDASGKPLLLVDLATATPNTLDDCTYIVPRCLR